MQRDINSGQRGDFQPLDYYHNQQIKYYFNLARSAAWGQINNEPMVLRAQEVQRQKKIKRYKKRAETTGSDMQTILNMYK